MFVLQEPLKKCWFWPSLYKVSKLQMLDVFLASLLSEIWLRHVSTILLRIFISVIFIYSVIFLLNKWFCIRESFWTYQKCKKLLINALCQLLLEFLLGCLCLFMLTGSHLVFSLCTFTISINSLFSCHLFYWKNWGVIDVTKGWRGKVLVTPTLGKFHVLGQVMVSMCS